MGLWYNRGDGTPRLNRASPVPFRGNAHPQRKLYLCDVNQRIKPRFRHDANGRMLNGELILWFFETNSWALKLRRHTPGSVWRLC